MELIRQCGTHRLSTHEAIGTGTGIGHAGVDDQGTDAQASGQMCAAQLHWSGTKPVLGEHPSHQTAGLQQKNREVFAIGFAHAGFDHANAQTSNGMQIAGLGGQ